MFLLAITFFLKYLTAEADGTNCCTYLLGMGVYSG